MLFCVCKFAEKVTSATVDPIPIYNSDGTTSHATVLLKCQETEYVIGSNRWK